MDLFCYCRLILDSKRFFKIFTYFIKENEGQVLLRSKNVKFGVVLSNVCSFLFHMCEYWYKASGEFNKTLMCRCTVFVIISASVNMLLFF